MIIVRLYRWQLARPISNNVFRLFTNYWWHELIVVGVIWLFRIGMKVHENTTEKLWSNAKLSRSVHIVNDFGIALEHGFPFLRRLSYNSDYRLDKLNYDWKLTILKAMNIPAIIMLNLHFKSCFAKMKTFAFSFLV